MFDPGGEGDKSIFGAMLSATPSVSFREYATGFCPVGESTRQHGFENLAEAA